MIDVPTLSENECLAYWVRFHRRAHGLTQESLAQRIGIAYTRISEIERGISNPELATLCKIAKALGVPLVSLLAPVDDTVAQKVG